LAGSASRSFLSTSLVRWPHSTLTCLYIYALRPCQNVHRARPSSLRCPLIPVYLERARWALVGRGDLPFFTGCGMQLPHFGGSLVCVFCALYPTLLTLVRRTYGSTVLRLCGSPRLGFLQPGWFGSFCSSCYTYPTAFGFLYHCLFQLIPSLYIDAGGGSTMDRRSWVRCAFAPGNPIQLFVRRCSGSVVGYSFVRSVWCVGLTFGFVLWLRSVAFYCVLPLDAVQFCYSVLTCRTALPACNVLRVNAGRCLLCG